MMNTKGHKMKTFTVHQLPSEHSLMRDLFFMEPFQVQEISDEFVMVAAIKANDLDQAFAVGNFVYEDTEEMIEIVAPMRSISTGDILCDTETDEYYLCTADGWEKIEMREEVL